jgi:hypothetical protein
MPGFEQVLSDFQSMGPGHELQFCGGLPGGFFVYKEFRSFGDRTDFHVGPTRRQGQGDGLFFSATLNIYKGFQVLIIYGGDAETPISRFYPYCPDGCHPRVPFVNTNAGTSDGNVGGFRIMDLDRQTPGELFHPKASNLTLFICDPKRFPQGLVTIFGGFQFVFPGSHQIIGTDSGCKPPAADGNRIRFRFNPYLHLVCCKKEPGRSPKGTKEEQRKQT